MWTHRFGSTRDTPLAEALPSPRISINPVTRPSRPAQLRGRDDGPRVDNQRHHLDAENSHRQCVKEPWPVAAVLARSSIQLAQHTKTSTVSSNALMSIFNRRSEEQAPTPEPQRAAGPL